MARHRLTSSIAVRLGALTVAVIGLVQADPRVAHAASFKEQQRCLALTLYWEARGEGRQGMIAVGWTVLNRVHSKRFPATPCAVVHQGGERGPCQYSWWCDGKSDRPRERQSWGAALGIAKELLRRPPRDPTRGALYFRNAGTRVRWRHVRTVRIGRHVFYR